MEHLQKVYIFKHFDNFKLNLPPEVEDFPPKSLMRCCTAEWQFDANFKNLIGNAVNIWQKTKLARYNDHTN